MELLRRALPPAIHVTAENSKEGTAVMQSFLVSLCNQAQWEEISMWGNWDVNDLHDNFPDN